MRSLKEDSLGVHVFPGFGEGGADCGTPAADESVVAGLSIVAAVEVDVRLDFLDPAAWDEILVGLAVEVCLPIVCPVKGPRRYLLAL